MAGKKTDKGGPDVAALHKTINELREQLAAATAGTAAAQLEAELAALKTDRDQVMANLADVSAKLETSIEKRTELAEALEGAQRQIRDMQNAGAGPVASAAAPVAIVITGPAISVRTRPGRQQTRYRAGRAFGPEAVPLALTDLTKDDLEALQNDRELVVTDHKPSQEA
ncbi:hypothetical protein [Bradyrhizobium sp. 191]|uniref:hypothetical protein n=1 Tax=Bradyrhizobium sp. 191 TaxID=2782659 RepID=UPI001FFEBA18|nr:hypothetical protein [Bradyrhizobium sp. 191]UPJ65239.1 hypothetical protein IVB23_35840 [Bradyrhizobium sp. 191]